MDGRGGRTFYPGAMPDDNDMARRTTQRRPPDIDTLPSPAAAVDSLGATVLSDSQGDRHDVAQPPETTFDVASRYTVRRVLGAGGMGEVRLCDDAWIGRDVAMKVARPGAGGSAAQTRGRFLREARVQGQLEHPSVVPVYDIGKTRRRDVLHDEAHRRAHARAGRRRAAQRRLRRSVQNTTVASSSPR